VDEVKRPVTKEVREYDTTSVGGSRTIVSMNETKPAWMAVEDRSRKSPELQPENLTGYVTLPNSA
jgi:hypothetical protein